MSDDTEAPVADARAAIIQAALHAFAKHGINGVSLRAILAAANQQNQSAIRYYFHNKDGLVEAVLAYVRELLAPDMQIAARQYQAVSPSTWTPFELTALICQPFIALDTQSPAGHVAIKFLSRLTWQEGGRGQLLLVQAVQPYFAQFADALVALNPNKPRDMLTFQLYLAVNSLIHGLADSSLLMRSPAEGVEQIRRDKPTQMLRYFVGYIAGGLFAPVGDEQP